MLTSKNGDSGPLFILKPISKDKEKKAVKPYYEISQNVNGEWTTSEDKTINTVTGRLVKVESVEEEYKGDKYFRARIYLRDGLEGYMINCRLNISCRSMLNSLFSLSSFEDISVKYYRTKNDYEAFYVSQAGEKVPWKFETTDLPAAKEVPFKGTVMRDFTDVDAFFVEQIAVLNDRIVASRNVGGEPNEEVQEEVEEVEQESEVSEPVAEETIGKVRKSAPKKDLAASRF